MITAINGTPHVTDIALIDGNDGRRSQILASLLSFYKVCPYGNSSFALQAIEQFPPKVVVIDETAPPLGGFEVLARIRKNSILKDVGVILVLANDRDGIVESVRQQRWCDCIVRPFRRSELIRRISSLTNRKVEQKWRDLPLIQQKVLNKSLEVIHSVSDAIDEGSPISDAALSEASSSLVCAVTNSDFRSVLNGLRNHDNYTYVHSVRVAILLTLLGKTIGLKESDLLLMAGCGLLHDVGKMTIPHDVLNKAGKLTLTEWQMMQGHVEASVRCLIATGNIHRVIISIAEQHHEKLDGTGYPKGLSGDAINELTRMAAISDVFSALTDVRVYKPAMKAEKALTIMSEEMAGHIDQHLLGTFGALMLDIGSEEGADTTEN
ncbi:MAG: HD domain-containing protein [Alphaproteobacteria bacterium]|nr:HD domain-containing protein [Alphaproteobacteria bacterium]